MVTQSGHIVFIVHNTFVYQKCQFVCDILKVEIETRLAILLLFGFGIQRFCLLCTHTSAPRERSTHMVPQFK